MDKGREERKKEKRRRTSSLIQAEVTDHLGKPRTSDPRMPTPLNGRSRHLPNPK